MGAAKASFSGRLNKGFVLSKPITQENYDEEMIYELERQGRLIPTRKRDGYKILAAVDGTGNVRLYTDGINEIDARLAHVKAELEARCRRRGITNALIPGEGIVDLGDADDFAKVASIMKSGTVKAIDRQKEIGFIRFMAFNVVFWNGGLNDLDYRETLARLDQLLHPAEGHHCFRVPVLGMSFDEAKAHAVANKWEGLVLYDREFRITCRTDGKAPARPKGSYKWKQVLEDDFIVRGRIMRHDSDLVKEVELWQIDPVSGKEFRCGMLGSFTKDMRARLAKATLPIVMQVEFDERFAGSGKLRNARFVRLREDKRWQDCLAQKSYPEAELKSKINTDGTRKA